jgi:hypothetical protein
MNKINNEVLMSRILSKKGQIATITTSRAMKTRKGMDAIIKTSTFQTRLGIDYDNLSKVVAKRKVGDLPAENQGLKYGEWAIFPFLILVKDTLQLRCNVFNSSFKGITEYTCNGVSIDKETAQERCLKSEFTTRSGLDVFNIKLDSIVDLV